ncbi:MAG TPA: response regulator [Candidatus Bathyarchaeia archaeon]|nr:response regulator [Candidatus Bathyarchaeia archaeon]
MISPTSAVATKLVVVVEDDPAILALCRVTFQRAQDGPLRGVRMVDAMDLQTARLVIAAETPDILVMDVRLPDGNGLDLVRNLARSDKPGRARVIIASASVLPAEREAALAAGADRFLPKPYRPADLVDAVVDLLREPSA